MSTSTENEQLGVLVEFTELMVFKDVEGRGHTAASEHSGSAANQGKHM